MDSRSTSKTFPGFSSVYSLHESGASRAFRADLDLSLEEAVALHGGLVRRPGAIAGRWAMGGAQPPDVIWTTLAIPVLFSARVVGVLREGGFTGWDVVPVELRGKGDEPLPTYFLLSVRGRCGPIDKSRSPLVDKIFPGGIFPVRRGQYFDDATWDGSDVFTPEGTGYKFVVEDVKHAFEIARVKNAMFEAVDEIESMDV